MTLHGEQLLTWGAPGRPKKIVADFVTQKTAETFELLHLDTSFLNTDPSTWTTEPAYINALSRISAIRVVNDFAERGVALMQQYNLALTKDESQRQFLLQVVENHRKRFSIATKECVTRSMQQWLRMLISISMCY